MEVSGGQLGKVDKHGRFFLPKYMLEELNQALPPARRGEEPAPLKLWISPSVDPCLWLMDNPEFRRMQKRLKTQIIGKKEFRQLQRKVNLLMLPCSPDGQGRIQIPSQLRPKAGITDQVLVIGTYQRIELWDPKVFERFESGDLGRSLDPADEKWKADFETVLEGEGL